MVQSRSRESLEDKTNSTDVLLPDDLASTSSTIIESVSASNVTANSTPPDSTPPTTATMASKAPLLPAMNPWEAQAFNHVVPDQSLSATNGTLGSRQATDALIYPGLYSSSGFDLMSILITVRSRPYPTIELGAIDCSVALILCDLELPDAPIVYASDSFYYLTGYSQKEVLGQNCRFLQTPGPSSSPATQAAAAVDKVAIKKMSDAVQSQQEIQLPVCNYKHNGQRFTNILSIVPLRLQPDGHRYAVGFLSEVE